MAFSTQSALIGGTAKNLIVAVDPNNNIAAAHVAVSSSGVEVGTSANPLTVTVSNGPAIQSISATTLPLPAGAAIAANQPALSVDGGALAHVVNFPVIQPVSATTLPLPTGAATAASQPALSADGGALSHVTNFPAIQAVSAAGLPLPAGAAQDGADASGITMPSGGNGIRGWLSGIYAKLGGTLSVGLATALPAGVNTIGAVTGAGAFTVTGQGATGVVPAGSPVSVAGIDGAGLKQNFRTDTFGTPTDAAWSAGAGSVISLAKALVSAQQATTAAVTSSSLVPPSPAFVQTTSLASSLVLKAAAGSLYACYVTTGSTAGWLMLFDAVTVAVNGTVTPKHSIYCPANATTEIELPFLTAEPFATGITAAFSSTGPFTFTASASAFIKGIVQ